MPRSRRPLLRAFVAVVAAALVAALPVVTPRPLVAVAAAPASGGGPGYWLVGGDGSVYPFGSAGELGSLRGTRLAHPVSGMTPTPSGDGYWMVGSDGGIFAFGDAGFFGSTGALKLNQPIVGMAATPSGQGYWFVAADGGIFAFGDAAFSGSTGALKLNKPIVGMAPTPTGKGYWFVASDGGIFAFGDAAFSGSTGATPLSRPIVGMAATPSGKGYWFVAADGGVFNFGDAAFLGSAGGKSLPAGVVVMSGVRRAGSPGGVTATTAVTSGPSATTATTRPARSGQAFQIGLVGDTGYTAGQVTTFDKVVTQMNSHPLAFVTHDGDFKDPQTACTDERFEAAKASFNRSTAPFVFAVGDNEWMDCDNANINPNEAPMDSLGRLDELREMFFHDDTSLGVNQMPLTTQRLWDKAPDPQFPHSYPENARWTKEGVVFATLNAPGPSDDIKRTSESHNRRAANLDWLESAFDVAEATNAPAVMIIWQADPWYSTGTIDFSPTWQYLTEALAARAKAFGKPVMLVHGDTHICRLDNPFPDVPNLRRLETHGTADSGSWIKATVDPGNADVFSFTTVTAGLTNKGQQEPSCPAVAP